MTPDASVLVDARPIFHPTAGGRGIGNYTLGLLQGLVSVGASVTALVEHAAQAASIAGVPPGSVEVMHRDVFRRAAEGSWYVATGMFLHPISFDPIPTSVTESGLPVASVMYDVIPFRRPDLYLADEISARLAPMRACLAHTADVHAAISAHAAETAIEELQLDPRRVRVVGAGVAPRFVLRPRQGPASGPVVAVTGAGPRKNTVGLIEAWSRVDARMRSEHGLVVVAGVEPGRREEWQVLAGGLGCADTIELMTQATDDDVVRLLQRAALVVQPSLEEGFGLTIAEAASCGAPVICSNTSALVEVLDRPSATFDPADPADMARAIERGLSDPEHRAVLFAAAARAARRWTWTSVADALLQSFDEVRTLVRRRALPTRVAVVERALADRSTVADVLDGAVHGTVTSLVDGPAGTDPRVSSSGARWPAGAFGRYVKHHEFDHVLTVVDDGDEAVATRVARRWPTHVWVRDGPVDPEVLASSRSVIVGSPRIAERLAGLVGGDLPVLVLPDAHGAWTTGDVGRSLAWWLEQGHRNARAVTMVGPGSTLS